MYGDDKQYLLFLYGTVIFFFFSQETWENCSHCICITLSQKISKARHYKEKVLIEICRKCRKYMIQIYKQELCKLHRYLLKSLLFHCDQFGLWFCEHSLWLRKTGIEPWHVDFNDHSSWNTPARNWISVGYPRLYTIFMYSFFPSTLSLTWTPCRMRKRKIIVFFISPPSRSLKWTVKDY